MPTQDTLNEWVDKGKLILCYDLDDTLIDFMFGIPYKERVKEVQERFNEGHYIVVATARVNTTKQEIEDILRTAGIPFHEVAIGTKPKAHLYIDDSAVNADDYFANPKKYLKIYDAIGFRINWLIRNRKAPR